MDGIPHGSVDQCSGEMFGVAAGQIDQAGTGDRLGVVGVVCVLSGSHVDNDLLDTESLGCPSSQIVPAAKRFFALEGRCRSQLHIARRLVGEKPLLEVLHLGQVLAATDERDPPGHGAAQDVIPR